MTDVIRIQPTKLVKKMYVTDANGNIGFDISGNFQIFSIADSEFGHVIVSEDANYSGSDLGTVEFVNPDEPVFIDGERYRWICGRLYKTVIMPDGREWMAENLDFKFPGISLHKDYINYPNEDNFAMYYNFDEETYGFNGERYGLIYYYKSIEYLQSRKNYYFPGWHVPDSSEWVSLFRSIGNTASYGYFTKGNKLKSKTGWINGNGTDDYGFNLKPAGYRSNGSSPSEAGSKVWYFNRYHNSGTQQGTIIFDGSDGISTGDYKAYPSTYVRLIRDAS